MWKLIIKNLWSRRRKNGWLFAELVLVSVVTWVVIDPVIVTLYDKSLPLGYDADRLCLVELATRSRQSARYDSTATDSATVVNNFFRLVDRVKTRPEVERAAPILSFTYLNSEGNTNLYCMVDTVKRLVGVTYFVPGHEFFETYGIRAAQGSGTAEELSAGAYGEKDLILTKNLMDEAFPGETAHGQTLASVGFSDTTYYRVVGVVENVRNYSFLRPFDMAFVPAPSITHRALSGEDCKILVRLKPGVDAERFVADFRTWMVKNMEAGNQFARAVYSYPSMQRDLEYERGFSNRVRLNLAIALFFGVSLCLGVIGTFWLQTRRRSEEAGILRSFGATPSYIMRMLLGEGTLLTTVAFLLGCFLYLQYALSEGLYNVELYNWMNVDTSYWVTNFPLHFGIVSAVVYVALLLIVWLGVAIPAYGISHTKPVDALRDE